MFFISEKDGAVANVRIRSTALTFSAKSLLDFYGIMPKKTSMYKISKAENGMIIIDMNTARERQTKDTEAEEQDS